MTPFYTNTVFIAAHSAVPFSGPLPRHPCIRAASSTALAFGASAGSAGHRPAALRFDPGEKGRIAHRASDLGVLPDEWRVGVGLGEPEEGKRQITATFPAPASRRILSRVLPREV